MQIEFECGGEKITYETDGSPESQAVADRLIRLSKKATDLKALVDSCFEEILRGTDP